MIQFQLKINLEKTVTLLPVSTMKMITMAEVVDDEVEAGDHDEVDEDQVDLGDEMVEIVHIKT